MRKLLTLAAIPVVLAACTPGGAAPAGATTAALAPTSALGPTTSAEIRSAGPSTSTTTAAVPVDRSTPEGAMSSWLRAMLAGDPETVCSLMAADGKAVADVPQAVETCTSRIGSRLEELRPLADAFEGLTIEGATVSGDTATFESARTKPLVAAQVISTFAAVRIDGDWYITQG